MSAVIFAEIKRLAAAGAADFSTGDLHHSLAGLGLYFADVCAALVSATTCAPCVTPDGSWRLEGGADTFGDALHVVVTIESGRLRVWNVGRP